MFCVCGEATHQFGRVVLRGLLSFSHLEAKMGFCTLGPPKHLNPLYKGTLHGFDGAAWDEMKRVP